MENYKIEGLDLLKLKGAQLVSTDVNGHRENCVLIPVRYNDIFVGVGREGKPDCAKLSLSAWVARPEYVSACKANHMDEPNYIAPTHTVEVRYGQKFDEAARTSAYNRIKADAANADKTEEELQKLARIAVNEAKRLGAVMTPIVRKEQPAYLGAAPTAPAFGAAAAPAVDANGQAMPDSFDDLPF